jgi:hypothetical protein
MISFDRVVRILVCHVVGVWQQLIEDPQVGRRPVSGHLSQSPSLFEHLSKNGRAAGKSRFSAAKTSMTCLNWSIARYK